MTIETQIQQAIAGGQSAAAALKIFALETADPKAKQEFLKAAQMLENAIQTLKNKQQYTGQQEPQYKQ